MSHHPLTTENLLTEFIVIRKTILWIRSCHSVNRPRFLFLISRLLSSRSVKMCRTTNYNNSCFKKWSTIAIPYDKSLLLFHLHTYLCLCVLLPISLTSTSSSRKLNESIKFNIHNFCRSFKRFSNGFSFS